MKRSLAPLAPFALAAALTACASAGPARIQDRPISFSERRVELTREYMYEHYGMAAPDIEIVPRVIVLHWTAIDDLEGSFRAFDREILAARPELADAGQVNVSIHFLVGRDGTIYRLMPETWM
ncbi:MAG: N-acetylmuramoyl-L-alanine amidase, partial [Longimicrobiales bacterium]